MTRSFADSLHKALPELIRRSGWQGLPDALPPVEQASAEERALWQELTVEVTPRLGFRPGRFGVLPLASLATGVVAASWVLLVTVPKIPSVPDTGVAQPESPRLESPVKPSSPSPARSLRSARRQTAGTGASKSQERGATRPQQVARSKPSSNESNRSFSITRPLPKSRAATPPQRPAATGLSDQMRSLEDSPTTSAASPGAQNLCQALTAQAPVPSGLEGFALVEVSLGAGEAMDRSTRTLISGGEQMDRFISRSVQKLVVDGLTGSSGRYRVILESAPRRWSCKEVRDGAEESVPEAETGGG